MRIAWVLAGWVVTAFVGCTAVNVADDPVDPNTTSSGGGAGGGSGGSGGSTSGGLGGSGGAVGACDDQIQNGDETDVDCGGSCPQCAAGSQCAEPADCLSGFCPLEDGVCCESACDGPCQACAESKTAVPSGTCGPIPAGSDPDVDCSAGPVSECGVSGLGCDGSGSCLLYPSATECQAPSCVNAIATGAGLCDGSGTCVPGAETQCSSYACDPDTMTCRTSCSSNGDCTAPATCNLPTSTCQSTQTFDTHNFAGYTEYPLDATACGCCGSTTTAQTADAFCVLAGMSSAVSWTTGNITGTNCYCWDCISVDSWASNCCSGQTSRPMILTVTCQ